MTLKGIYIDELTQIPLEFYLMALSRLRVSGARLIATTNPDNPKHFVNTEIILNEKLNKKVWKFLLDDNIFLDEEYKIQTMAESTWKIFQHRVVLKLKNA